MARLDTDRDATRTRLGREEVSAGMEQSWCEESVWKRKREWARKSFSSRQQMPSDSYMKVTALAALQLLPPPAVSQPSPQPAQGGHWFKGHHLGPSIPTVKWPPMQAAGHRQHQSRGDCPIAALPVFHFACKAYTRLILPQLTSAVYCSQMKGI